MAIGSKSDKKDDAISVNDVEILNMMMILYTMHDKRNEAPKRKIEGSKHTRSNTVSHQ